MTELDSDIAAVEHRLWMARKGVNPWEIAALEKRLVTLKAERDEAFKAWEATVKPYQPPPKRAIPTTFEPDFAFTPMLADETFYECQKRVNRGR